MWYYEVIFKDTQGKVKTFHSKNGFKSMGEGFIAYIEDLNCINEALVKMKCQLVLSEHIVFDNDRTFGG